MKNYDFDITKSTADSDSFRAAKLRGLFELEQHHLSQRFCGSISLPSVWNVGAIVGRSGTGKSTIAHHLFGQYIKSFQYGTKPIIDEMAKNKTVEEITRTFTRVGFSSPPSWFKSYGVLSNGEKMRVDLARSILDGDPVIAFDEFTSVVDRDVARVVSDVVQKSIREQNRQFIAITCHYDVLEYLQPDWVFSTDEMKNIDVKKNGQISSLISLPDLQRTGKYFVTITI